jgi:pimeloyl-ACP methyl ester carboxylesterase
MLQPRKAPRSQNRQLVPTFEPIEGTTADGVVLRGALMLGTTTTWLICVHDVDGDIDVWRALIAGLGKPAWNVLALDLRGHGGSEGVAERLNYALDVDLGVTLARRREAKHIAIVAAGIGALAALESVARAVDETSFALPDSLILLSPGPLQDSDLARLRGEGLAKMIISGSRGTQAEDARSIMEASIGWTISVTLPTKRRSTDLLIGQDAAHIADKIGTFVREQAVLGGPGVERLRPSPRTPTNTIER